MRFMAFPGATSTEGNGKRQRRKRKGLRRNDYAAGMREDSVADNVRQPTKTKQLFKGSFGMGPRNVRSGDSRRIYVFLFANRRRFCLAAAAIRANKGAGIAARPRAEILASCAAQRAASSRHCRMRRLRSCSTIATFPEQVRPVSDLAGFPAQGRSARDNE